MKTIRDFKIRLNANLARWSLRFIIKLKILYNDDINKIKKALSDFDGIAGGRSKEDRRKGKDRRKE